MSTHKSSAVASLEEGQDPATSFNGGAFDPSRWTPTVSFFSCLYSFATIDAHKSSRSNLQSPINLSFSSGFGFENRLQSFSS
jgi:hypothetical protein